MLMRITVLLPLCLTLLAGCGPKAPPEPMLLLSVTSVPPGAQVWVDGMPAGVTPLKKTVRPGEHLLEITKAGYRTVWHRVPASAGNEFQATITLTPLGATVVVESTPTGALLSLNGEGKGKTPVLIPQLPAGSYEAELTAAGYAAKHFRFTIDSARPRKIVEPIESLSCTLQVWTSPGGTEVYINDKFYGLTPPNPEEPLTISELIAGEYTLSVRKAGFKGITQPLLLKRQEKKDVHIPPLVGLPGGLEIVTLPAGADVYDAARELLGQTPYQAANLPAGKMTVRIQKRGYADETRELIIAPGATQKLELTLSRFFGSLNFTTEPPDCKVFIDGQSMGKTVASDHPKVSGIFEYDGLTPGRHVLELQHPEYETSTVRVTIEQGLASSLGSIKLKARWLPTHRLTLSNGNVYEGVLVKKNNDGSIVFETAPTIRIGYDAAEVKALVPLKTPRKE